MRIATIIGTRPHFIKAAVLSPEIRKHHSEILIHTGQHYDTEMSDIFFDQLPLPQPDFDLNVCSGNQCWQTATMMIKLEKIFERFYQINRDSFQEYSGAGLGLTIVKQIIEAHQGHISVDSTPGQGTTFSFWLPINEAVSAAN